MTDNPHRTGLLVLAVVVGLTLGVAATGVQATSDLPSTNEDGTIDLEVVDESDETVTVELSSAAADVAGFQANLSYDPTDVQVDEVSFGDLDQTAYERVDSETGHVFVTESTVGDESVDEPTLATITFAGDGLDDLTFVEGDSLVTDGDGEVITSADEGNAGVGPSPGGNGADDGSDESDDGDDESNDGDDESNDGADDENGDSDDGDETDGDGDSDGGDETDGDSDDGDDESNDGADDENGDSDDGDEDDGLPGFTIGSAVAAVVGLLALGAARR